MPRVLIVDDDTLLSTMLADAGFDTECVTSGEAGLDAAARGTFDLILLDLSASGAAGSRFCRELRRRGDATPIIVVSVRPRIGESVEALDLGADDYAAKPFERDDLPAQDLMARIRALLRRSGGSKGVQPLRFLDLELDPATLIATRGDLRAHLTRTEFALLHLFMRNPNRVLSRNQLLSAVWSHDFAAPSNSPEIYVGYLRRKLEAGGRSRLLHTIRGAGYVLSEHKPSQARDTSIG